MIEPIVWTPGNWDDLKAGSNVRLEHPNGLSVLSGQVDSHASLWSNRLVVLRNLGFELFVPVPPKPILPSEPNTIWADKNGHPWFVTDMGNLATHQIELHGPAELAAPFVRLEPVAETAKAVLASIQNKGMFERTPDAECKYTLWESDFNRVAAEFGVTDA